MGNLHFMHGPLRLTKTFSISSIDRGNLYL